MSFLTGFKSAPFELFANPTSAAASANQANCSDSLASLVGSKWTTGDGREFVLVQNGGTALVAGQLIQSPANIANMTALSPATTGTTGYVASAPIVGAVGAKVIQLATGGTTAVLANQFQGGYLSIVTGLGIGTTLKIASNTAAAISSAFTVTCEDPFTVLTDTTSRFTLQINPYGAKTGTDYTTGGVVIQVASGSTQTGVPIGVANYPIVASTATVPSYGFIQTRGLCAVLGTDTSAIGTLQGISTTAGQVIAYSVGSKLSPVGVTAAITTSGYANLINLQL